MSALLLSVWSGDQAFSMLITPFVLGGTLFAIVTSSIKVLCCTYQPMNNEIQEAIIIYHFGFGIKPGSFSFNIC